jgi:hypothetical protein
MLEKTDDEALLGAVTVEIFGLGLQSFNCTLDAVRMMLAGEV